MRFFVGVDGGGSSTRAVVVNDTFQVIGRGEAGASNHYVVGVEGAAQNCREAAEAALANAARIETDLRRERITAWGFCLAGVRREGDAALVRQQLARWMGIRPFILDHDAAARKVAPFMGSPGIVLSAGTGAICFGVDEAGERFFRRRLGPGFSVMKAAATGSGSRRYARVSRCLMVVATHSPDRSDFQRLERKRLRRAGATGARALFRA
jgi:N-acetylglucosamine kinase-like BadF-type ATPase